MWQLISKVDSTDERDESELGPFPPWNITGTYRGSWRFTDLGNNSSKFPDFKKSNGNSVLELMTTPTKITGVHYVQATWHKGHSLAQTVFSCIYLLRPDRTSSHTLLHSCCQVVRPTCNAVVGAVSDTRTNEAMKVQYPLIYMVLFVFISKSKEMKQKRKYYASRQGMLGKCCNRKSERRQASNELGDPLSISTKMSSSERWSLSKNKKMSASKRWLAS